MRKFEEHLERRVGPAVEPDGEQAETLSGFIPERWRASERQVQAGGRGGRFPRNEAERLEPLNPFTGNAGRVLRCLAIHAGEDASAPSAVHWVDFGYAVTPLILSISPRVVEKVFAGYNRARRVCQKTKRPKQTLGPTAQTAPRGVRPRCWPRKCRV